MCNGASRKSGEVLCKGKAGKTGAGAGNIGEVNVKMLNILDVNEDDVKCECKDDENIICEWQ